MARPQLRELALNGGRVRQTAGQGWELTLPSVRDGYVDAQIDDYGSAGVTSRSRYLWRPGTCLRVRARFSHGRDALVGTAGFGFWNAPYGDPSVKWPALPQAAWFFFGSPPNDLPFHTAVPGRGWFAATIDVRPAAAALLAPAAPLVVLLSQSRRLRARIWPAVQRRMRVASADVAPLDVAATLADWRAYELDWLPEGCVFRVDDRELLRTPFSPRGPLGFVAWIDNQYLIATPHGRVGWGTLPVPEAQQLALAELTIAPCARSGEL